MIPVRHGVYTIIIMIIVIMMTVLLLLLLIIIIIYQHHHQNLSNRTCYAQVDRKFADPDAFAELVEDERTSNMSKISRQRSLPKHTKLLTC